MKENIKDFLLNIVNEKPSLFQKYDEDLKIKAQKLLDEDLKEETEQAFSCFYTSEESIYSDLREIVRKNDKNSLVRKYGFYNCTENFINDNWNNLNKVIQFLKELIDEYDSKAKEERIRKHGGKENAK